MLRAARPLLSVTVLAAALGASTEVRAERAGLLALRLRRGTPVARADVERQLLALVPRVLSPDKVRARLREAPENRREIEAARRKLQRADRAALAMERAASLDEARAAITALRRIGARYFAPRFLARAHTALALALLLKPAALERAKLALVAAVRIDPSLERDPDRFPPRATALLRQARHDATRAASRLPAKAALAQLAQTAAIDRLAYAELQPRASSGGDTNLSLDVVVFDRAENETVHTRVQLHPSGSVARAVALAIHGALHPKRASPAVAAPAPPPPDRAEVDRPDGRPIADAGAKKPWYTRWWIWAVAGAVVAGVAIGVTVAVTRPDRPYQLAFHF